MDWANLLNEGWRLLLSGGVGAFVASLVTNGINHRATARQAELDRTSRALVSRRDRTYTDARMAFMNAVALLGRLREAVSDSEGEHPVQSYASPSKVSDIEASLAIFGSTEAAQVFRASVDSYFGARRESEAVLEMSREERELETELDRDSGFAMPKDQELAKLMRDAREGVLAEGMAQLEAADASRQLLTKIASAQLAREVEL